MKSNKYILSTGLLALALTGCTDLDVDVKSQYTAYPDNEIAVEAKMSDVYFHLRGPLGRRYMEAMSLSSDEFTCLAFNGGYYDEGTYAHQALHTSTYEDASLDWYPTVAEGITKANKVILELGGNKAGASVATARVMRALYHFVLMDAFGDIPVLNYIPEDGEQVDRQPRKAVAEFIEQELLEAIPDLTEEVNSNTYGKPTKWMAKALLAKLYINWAVYTAPSVDQYDAATAKNEKLDACIQECQDIIDSKKFNLGSMEYRFKFNHDNGPKVEDFIYAMPFDATTQQGLQWMRPRSFKDLKGMVPNYFGCGSFSQSFGGNIVVTPECAELFCLEGDQRNLSILGGKVFIRDPKTLLPTDEPFMYKDKQLEFTKDIKLDKIDNTIDVGGGTEGKLQGYHSIKWFMNETQYNQGRNQSNDLPIFRFADILMMQAEAIVRNGGNSKVAMDNFNAIRAYAHAPLLDHAPSLKELLDERGREFFDELWRRNDQIRFGTYEDEYFPRYKSGDLAACGGNFDPKHRIFPIHKDVLNTNPSWKQNPGY